MPSEIARAQRQGRDLRQLSRDRPPRQDDRRPQGVLEILVVNDIYNVTGAVPDATPTSGTDQQGPALRQLHGSTATARQLFGQLTGNHLPDKLTDFTYKLGIILDGELYSAPSIQSTISDRGEITGTFTKEEVKTWSTCSTPAACPPR